MEVARSEAFAKLQTEVDANEEKLSAQHRKIAELEGHLRDLGNGEAKPHDPDAERGAGGQVNLEALDKLLQAAGVSGELLATV